jgi:DNA-binding transcriptional LysR family regulator
VQLRQLEYVVALAKEGHFARAAAVCFVSQPTLSDGIRHLESELGVAIVRRGQRFEGFTPEGELVLEFARRLLHDRDELLGQLGPADGDHAGRLRLGAIPTSLPPLPLVTVPFLERHPHVELTVRSLSSAEIDRELKSFDLDAGITYLDGDPIEHVRTLALYEEQHLLLVGDEVGAKLSGPVTFADAASLPLCLLTRDMQNRRIVERLFEHAGTAVSPRIETNSISALLAHVRTGRYASIVPQTWLQFSGVPAGTRALRFAEGDAPSTIGLVWLDVEPQPLLTRALIAVVETLSLQPVLDEIVPGAPSSRPKRR